MERTGMTDPEKQLFFLVTAINSGKKGAAFYPLNYRVKIPGNRPDTKKRMNKPFFLSMNTVFNDRNKKMVCL